MTDDNISAKDYLNNIRKQEFLLRALEREYEELNSVKGIHAISLSEKVSGGRQSDLSGIVVKLQSYIDKINREWDKLIDMRTEGKELIHKLDNPTYQALLIDRYMNCLTWEQIAVNMSYSYHHVIKLHGKALISFEKIFESRKVDTK